MTHENDEWDILRMNHANTPDALIFIGAFFVLLGLGALLQWEQKKRHLDE